MQPENHNPKGKRNRSVALNERGVAELLASLEEVWKSKHAPARLTRILRAEIFGLSVKTSDRICDRLPVDRASLSTAFAAVGLEFTEVHLVTREPSPVEDSSSPVLRDGRRIAFVLGTLLILALVAFAAAASRPKPLTIYSPEYRVPQLLSSGLTDYHAGRYESARSKFKEGLALAQQARDAGGLAEAHKALGELAVYDGDYPQAEELFTKALVLVESSNAFHLVPRLKQLIGQSQELQGKADQARDNYLESLKGFTSVPDEYAAAMIQMDIGGLERDSGNLPSAEAWFLTCEATLERLDRSAELAALAKEFAQLEVKRGNYDIAIKRLQRALTYWESASHPRWQARTHLELARVYLAKGDENSSLGSARSAVRHYREVGDKVGEAKARSLLSSVQKTGQHQAR